MELGFVASAGPLGFQMWWYGEGSGLNGLGPWVAGQGGTAALGETMWLGMPPMPLFGDSVRLQLRDWWLGKLESSLEMRDWDWWLGKVKTSLEKQCGQTASIGKGDDGGGNQSSLRD